MPCAERARAAGRTATGAVAGRLRGGAAALAARNLTQLFRTQFFLGIAHNRFSVGYLRLNSCESCLARLPRGGAGVLMRSGRRMLDRAVRARAARGAHRAVARRFGGGAAAFATGDFGQLFGTQFFLRIAHSIVGLIVYLVTVEFRVNRRSPLT